MTRIQLIHWNAAEAEERAARLRRAGYEVTYALRDGPALMRALAEDPPGAIVIDLDRLPSQGRDVALTLRQRRGTRFVPLVFVGGDPEKVEAVEALLPDATYTTWSRIRSALKSAIAHPPAAPIAHHSVFAGYSGTPLLKKLGVAPGGRVALQDPPPDVSRILGELPAGTALQEGLAPGWDVALWFVRRDADLAAGMRAVAERVADGRLWIIWPKKTGSLASDVSERSVRAAGLAAGLVDFKVCAVDETWSGLCFARRKKLTGTTKE